MRQVRGRHNLYAGFGLTRRQINGYEASSHRGSLVFQNAWGNDAITNLRLGRPYRIAGARGYIHRGFRRWETSFYLGDDFKAANNFSVQLGLRYEGAGKPSEVNRLNEVPFDGDWNNFAPQAGFAYRFASELGCASRRLRFALWRVVQCHVWTDALQSTVEQQV